MNSYKHHLYPQLLDKSWSSDESFAVSSTLILLLCHHHNPNKRRASNITITPIVSTRLGPSRRPFNYKMGDPNDKGFPHPHFLLFPTSSSLLFHFALRPLGNSFKPSKGYKLLPVLFLNPPLSFEQCSVLPVLSFTLPVNQLLASSSKQSTPRQSHNEVYTLSPVYRSLCYSFNSGSAHSPSYQRLCYVGLLESSGQL